MKQKIRLLIFSALACLAGSKTQETCDLDLKNPEKWNYITFSKIDQAWELTRGNNVKIAILDWAFHLRGKDRDKYIDPVSLVPGEKIGNMRPWHGEWMATIAHSVAPEAKIIPIRTNCQSPCSYQDKVAQGIIYAVDKGAVVVTSSMGPLIMTEEIQKAIDYAEQKGVIFIDVHPEVERLSDGKLKTCDPEILDKRIIHPGIISVPEHPVDPDTNRGLYTWPYDIDPVYQDGWGFSNAPPIVAGVIALIKSLRPVLKPEDIRVILKKTTDDVDGFKILNAYAAV